MRQIVKGLQVLEKQSFVHNSADYLRWWMDSYFFFAKRNLFLYFIQLSSTLSLILWLSFARDNFFVLFHIIFLYDPFLCWNIFGCLCKWPHKGKIYINPIYCPLSTVQMFVYSHFFYSLFVCYDHPRQAHSLWYEHCVIYNIGCWRHFRIEHTHTHTHIYPYI